jgi:pyruvate kinase
MALYWGVIPISCVETETHDDEIELALKTVQLREELPNGSRAVITGGLMAGKPGSTSVMEIREMSYK